MSIDHVAGGPTECLEPLSYGLSKTADQGSLSMAAVPTNSSNSGWIAAHSKHQASAHRSQQGFAVPGKPGSLVKSASMVGYPTWTLPCTDICRPTDACPLLAVGSAVLTLPICGGVPDCACLCSHVIIVSFEGMQLLMCITAYAFQVLWQ